MRYGQMLVKKWVGNMAISEDDIKKIIKLLEDAKKGNDKFELDKSIKEIKK